jgi:hypothetical protein
VVLASPLAEMSDDDASVLVTPPDLADALCDPATLRRFCLALAHNHR